VLLQDTGEAQPEDLIFSANCELEEIEKQDKIIPIVLYFTEACRVILDVLR